nr:hypothetical protein [uncultured Butyrivibrio sp.]
MVLDKLISKEKLEDAYDRAYTLLLEAARDDMASEYEILRDNSEYEYGLLLIIYCDSEHKYEYDRIMVNALDYV